ncbi:MAG: isocitrate/isopropylmalate dehydrogenase family protein, partial [Coriobacteriia bacterium]
MAKHTVTLIPGDGIGPELTAAMTRVVEATGVDIEWEVAEAGADVMEKYGTPLPEHVLDSIRKNKVAIKGPITTPVGTGFRSVNVSIRKELDLYACLRPAFSIKGNGARYDDIDLVIVRENTEDLYAGIEFEEGSEGARKLIEFAAAEGAGIIRPDSGISLKPISISRSRRIVEYAFDYAIANGRKKVTAVHKANILKYSDGLFLKVAREVAAEYKDSGIEFEDYIVDATCMQLVLHPELWDVLVLPNLYGDILSDLAAGLIGGLGIAPGANIGADYAVFEPTHGSAPKYAGKDMANPTAEILSAVL